MKHLITFAIIFLISKSILSQSYTSYFTGDTTDVSPVPSSGVCLMGGATEDDSAMVWFLNKANGGDVVVIRVTGADGYNNYMYSQLGVSINSVETLIIPSMAAANDPYVRKQLRNAEAVWIAGGNQANYINYWNNTAVDSALNYLINTKQGVIGGTSAGMAVQGQAYYSALNNSVTSAAALANPYNADVTIGYNDFIQNPKLNGILTDTHFDNPDRKGRLVSFLARCIMDYSKRFIGIACDEYTAVCIGNDMKAIVYGGYPTHDDNAYFVVPDTCTNNGIYKPENCTASSPLTWDRSMNAIKVYQVKGTSSGANYFDLNSKKSGMGGTWKNWYVQNGVLTEGSLSTPPCSSPTLITEKQAGEVSLYPIPVNNLLHITSSGIENGSIELYSLDGKNLIQKSFEGNNTVLDISSLASGIYFLKINERIHKILKQ